MTTTRRSFLGASAAASALSLAPASYAKVLGANERIGVGYLGVGGRCQAHINVVGRLKKEEKGVDHVAVCDVWDGNDKVGRGLHFSAKRCGLAEGDSAHIVKDYRKLLDQKEVDVVCI